jgi:hypothetical protein
MMASCDLQLIIVVIKEIGNMGGQHSNIYLAIGWLSRVVIKKHWQHEWLTRWYVWLKGDCQRGTFGFIEQQRS